jgi:branched-subunit amino acid aminotransferase/4-amino-4-deoxychorismate lyase
MRRCEFMPPGSVLTLETTRGGARRVREDPSLAEASAHLPVGAYSTLRTYGRNRVVRLEAHLRRLEESVASQGSPARIDPDTARRLVAVALEETRHPESRLRLIFAPPRLFVSVEPFVPLPPVLYEQGVACVTLPRIHRDHPHVKDTQFIPTARGAYHVLPPGIEEGLLLADDGSILEGLSSNFLALFEGALHTEEERALAGITRELVLELAAAQLRVVPRAVRRDELVRVREAFITSASREVLPVVRIDGQPVGDGDVGPRTRAIVGGFAALVRREAAVVE